MPANSKYPFSNKHMSSLSGFQHGLHRLSKAGMLDEEAYGCIQTKTANTLFRDPKVHKSSWTRPFHLPETSTTSTPRDCRPRDIMGVGRGGRGGQGPLLDFEISSKKRLFFQFRGVKTNFTALAPPWKKFWENPLLPPTPGKDPSDAHVST